MTLSKFLANKKKEKELGYEVVWLYLEISLPTPSGIFPNFRCSNVLFHYGIVGFLLFIFCFILSKTKNKVKNILFALIIVKIWQNNR